MRGKFIVREIDPKDAKRARVIDRLLNHIWKGRYDIRWRDDTTGDVGVGAVRRTATGVRLVSRHFSPVK